MDTRSTDYRRFLDLLREARRAAGLTQYEVARKLGKPQSYVAKCESGERRIDVIELRRFALIYGKPEVFLGSALLESMTGPDLGSGIVLERPSTAKEDAWKRKLPAAVIMGKRGGSKGGAARNAKLSARRRKQIARKAAMTRWSRRRS